MKACVNCEFVTRIALTGPNGQPMMAYACLQPDLQDPVEGNPLPCHTVRSNESFCGISGKKWKEKIKEAEVISEDRKVIQLK